VVAPKEQKALVRPAAALGSQPVSREPQQQVSHRLPAPLSLQVSPQS